MCFIVGSRSLVRFKTKLSVTTIDSNFHLLPIFCHKKLHLRCCIGLLLNIVTCPVKILKGIRGCLPWSTATLGKYEKLTVLDALKIHFQRFFALSWVFCIKLNFLHLISNGLNEVNINSLTQIVALS